MLAMADWHGYIGASVPGLAARARVPLDKCREALETFLSPDPDSRTTEHEGRRIAVADGGWVLLNHAKYRALMSEDDRRERSRLAMQRMRERRKAAVSDVNHALTMLPHTDTDTDLDTDTRREEDSGAVPLAPLPPSAFLGDSNIKAIPSRAMVLISQAWELPEQWGMDAEALGWKGGSILKEAEKFRQYWTVGKGGGKRRTVKGWRQSWSNWLSKAEART
jgi:hypothetical protein